MPITLTFDLPDAYGGNDRNRIRLAFRRLGWETIGGTAYRYPPLDPAGAQGLNAEDWFNHVIPALMYLRALVERRGVPMTNFTIDAFSSTGARANLGPEIQAAEAIAMSPPGPGRGAALSEQRLRDWIAACSAAV
jgi:hypothetical protein